MSKNKGIKTSIVAIVYGIIIVGMVIAMILGKTDMAVLEKTIAVTTPVAVLMIGWFSKDSTSSHTKP